jgi:hypothetical protein
MNRNGIVFGKPFSPLKLFAIAAIVAACGCSDRPATVAVSGKVQIDNQPLKFGSIVFVPEKGRQSSDTLDSEGRFSLTCYETNDGAQLGKHRIQVFADEMVNSTTMRHHVPKKYSDLQQSGLSEEIKSPRDDIVINLTWARNNPGKPYTETLGKPAEERLRIYKKQP